MKHNFRKSQCNSRAALRLPASNRHDANLIDTAANSAQGGDNCQEQELPNLRVHIRLCRLTVWGGSATLSLKASVPSGMP
ncbi:hypothetical protein WJX72_005544 [[Myrmecia] bisecta]|uniref:Uncharacterized protein n=1 Tax=[Myrmecia] bisecta TaxID=41462 RepID=A0AAW1QF85_9CHLO